MMRKMILTIAATLMMVSTINAAPKGVTINASDTKIEYTGRTLIKDGNVSFDWSGVYVRVKFKGTKLTMRCSDSSADWFNLWKSHEFSAQEDSKVHICSKDTTVVLVEGLKKGEHEIILQKRTEGEQGRFTIHSFSCDGEFLQSNRRKERHIEFIGDSYTCGYGTESLSKNDPFEAKTENCNLTYAAIASRYFDADFNLVSHSGQGVCRNYDDFRPGYNMPDRYKQTFDQDKNIMWDASRANYKPDIVVIYLCTNDFSTARQPHIDFFVSRYIEIFTSISENYGKNIPILCMASNANPLCTDYIREACTRSGLKNATYMNISPKAHNDSTELGASSHPNYNGHKKVASCVIPYISTLTGWEMTEKAYK